MYVSAQSISTRRFVSSTPVRGDVCLFKPSVPPTNKTDIQSFNEVLILLLNNNVNIIKWKQEHRYQGDLGH